MPCRIPVLLALTMGLPSCRDRAEDVTGGTWLATPINQMPEGAVVDAFEALDVAEDPILDEVEEVSPKDENAALRLEADALAAKGEHLSAIGISRRLLARQPKSADAAIFHGKHLQRAKRHADAMNTFAQALRRSPNDPDALYGHALSALALGNLADAKGSAQALQTLRPDDPDVRALVSRTMTLETSGE